MTLIWLGLLLLKSVERGGPRANRGSLLALAILGWGSFALGAAIVFAGMFAGDYLTVIIAAVLFGAVGFVLRRASARTRPLPLPPPLSLSAASPSSDIVEHSCTTA